MKKLFGWSIAVLAAMTTMATLPEAQVRSLDGEWLVRTPVKSATRPTPDKAAADPASPTTHWVPIKVPHYNWHAQFPDTYPNFDKRSNNYQFTGKPTYVSGWFSREFESEATAGQRLYLDFGAVAFETEIYVNGKFVTGHKGGFTGFEVDVTDFVKPGKNTLRMWVANDFGEHPPRHVYGKMFMATANQGGITGGVGLRLTGQVNLRRLLIDPRFAAKTVELRPTVRNYGRPGRFRFMAELTGADGTGETVDFPAQELPTGETELTLTFPLKAPVEWSPENPHLYQVRFDVIDDATGEPAARVRERFGFREFKAKGDKFYLNGKRIRLYCGNILTAGAWERFAPGADREARADIRRQKKQGVNTIRYHMGGADSHRLLQIADEEGVLVIDEFPMFHRVFSDLNFKTPAERTVFMDTTRYEWKARMLRDYNHPAAVIWTLSNEVWTDSTADELNDLYRALQGIDRQGRPMNTGSGLHSFGIPTVPVATDVYDSHLYNVPDKVPAALAKTDFDRYFGDLVKLYGAAAYAKPAMVIESMHVGHHRPAARIPADRELSVAEYLKLLEENRKGYPNWYGLRAYLDGAAPDGRELVDAIVKDGFESFRKDGRFQGFHLWTGRRDIIYPGYEQLITPTFLAAEELTANCFTDGALTFNLVVIDDSLQGGTGKLTLTLRDGEKSVAAQTLPVTVKPGDDRTVLPVAWQPDGGFPAGLYRLELALELGNTTAKNGYPVYLANRAGLPEFQLERKTAKYDFNTGALRGLPLPELKSLDELANFGAAVIATARDKAPELAANGTKIADFVRNGGKLLLLGTPPGSDLEYLIPGYELREPAAPEEAASTVLEPARPDHPVFAGLSARHLLRLNGCDNIAGTTHLYPLSGNLLATGFPAAADGPGMLIAEFKIGKGAVIFSHAELLSRPDDPAAVRLLRNLVNYTGMQKIAGAELQAGTTSPLRKKFAAIPKKNCFVIDLGAVANRNFTDDPAGERGWTKVGTPDFRQGPRGEQKFSGLPYRIAGENGRALILKGIRTPDCPERVTVTLPRPEPIANLIAFQTAWYPEHGKELFRYVIEYADNSNAVWPIVEGRDIGDWYAPYDRANAAVAWQGANPTVKAPFGYYAAIWENPEPEKPVRSITVESAGTGVPILFALTAVRHRDYATAELANPWDQADHDFDRTFGMEQTGNGKFTMTRAHSWASPAQRGKILDAKEWKRLRFTVRADRPYRFKVLYQSPSGDNAVSDWVAPVRSADGVDFYDIDTNRLVWKNASSPEAKEWGGRTGEVSMFALDFYADAGTRIEIGRIRLTAN